LAHCGLQRTVKHRISI